ncbi:LysR family transcriptional regulator [Jannaschia seohaensis]|uniref:DNA-binding transcriptional LysR family regulator n=1 Tax=Jannaschia seohaensis TaxID=475081 RepID=A0A2Y9AIW1_9RHOB|nr:LysR family transcriptional regulator [Jannaschia seohaensis]PWJ20371.1 DNA-binding transcriptional LysR family regulator [Jannaschia seohaensis]SSA44431.1 DNA-binding transcriptional regulator, LysR family [Jannaschia seohaensis]
MHLENWDDLKFVLAMKRHGTMSAAARHLNTNVATVSRRLDRMSQELDLPLFKKRGQGFVSTSAADRLAEVAEAIEHRLRSEIGTIRSIDKTARIGLDIAAPPAVHTHYLLPRLPELVHLFPNVVITLTDKVFAQGLGEADIQIRIGRPEGGRLKARKFRDYAMRVYHGRDHVLNGEWIGLSNRYPDANLLKEIYRDARDEPRYRVEEMPLVHQLIRMTGLPGVLPDFSVAPSDGFVAAQLEGNSIQGELWITYHETRHNDAILRSVVDWICRTEPPAGHA